MTAIEQFGIDGLPAAPLRLARLVLLPALPRLHTPMERLDAALGPELARFLVTALSGTEPAPA